MSKGKQKRESEVRAAITGSATPGTEPNTPASRSQADVGSSSKGNSKVEVVYRLADGSKEWSKRLSRKKTLPDILSKISKHLSLSWSPDVRLAHVRDGGREVEIYDEYDFQAFRDRALASAKKEPILVKVYPPGGPSRRRSPSPSTPSLSRPITATSLVGSSGVRGDFSAPSKSSKKSKAAQLPAAAVNHLPGEGEGVFGTTSATSISKARPRKSKGKEKAIHVEAGPDSLVQSMTGKTSGSTAQRAQEEITSSTDQLEQSPKKKKKKPKENLPDPRELPPAQATPAKEDPPPIPHPAPSTVVPKGLPPSALKLPTATSEKKARKRVSLAVPDDNSPEISHVRLAPLPDPNPPRAYSPSIPSEQFSAPAHDSVSTPKIASAPTKTSSKLKKPLPEPSTDQDARDSAGSAPAPVEIQPPSSDIGTAALSSAKVKKARPKKTPPIPSEVDVDVRISKPPQVIVPASPPESTKEVTKSKSKKRPRSPSNSPAKQSAELASASEALVEASTALQVALEEPIRPKKKAKKVDSTTDVPTSIVAEPLDLPAIQPATRAPGSFDETATNASPKPKSPRVYKGKQPASSSAAPPSNSAPPPDAPLSEHQSAAEWPVAAKSPRRRSKKLSIPSPLLPSGETIRGSTASPLLPNEPLPQSPRASRISLSYYRDLRNRPSESNLVDSSAFSLASGEEAIAARRKLKKRRVVSSSPWLPSKEMERDKTGKLQFKEVEWDDSDEDVVEERVTEFGVVLDTVPKRTSGLEPTPAAAKSSAGPSRLSAQLSDSGKAKASRKISTAETKAQARSRSNGANADTTDGDAEDSHSDIMIEDEVPISSKKISKRKAKQSDVPPEAAVEEKVAEEAPKKAAGQRVRKKVSAANSNSPKIAITPMSPPEDSPPAVKKALERDGSESPFSRFKPLPKSTFCIICFEPVDHLQIACPIVKSGLRVLKITANERRKLRKSKSAEDREWAKGSLEAIQSWMTKLERQEEIRKKVTEDLPSETAIPAVPITPKQTRAPKRAKTKQAAPESLAKEATPHLPSPSPAPTSSSQESSEARQVDEDVLISAPPSTTKSPAQRDIPQELILRPASLLRLAAEGARDSDSGMSASSVAIESDSGSDHDSEAESESEGEAEDDDHEDEDSGSNNDASSESGSDSDSDDDEASDRSSDQVPRSSLQNPDDLLHHFLTAPLSRKDQRAARKSLEGMRASQLSAVDDTESDGPGEEEDAESSISDSTGPRPASGRIKRAASRDSSIGDFEDGQPPLLSPYDEVPQDESIEQSDEEDDEEGDALGMRGMKLPPTVSADITAELPAPSRTADHGAELQGTEADANADMESEADSAADTEPEAEVLDRGTAPAESPLVKINGTSHSPTAEVQPPSSSLEPTSQDHRRISLYQLDRDADSISVNGMEGAIAYEEARGEEEAPEREAFGLSPLLQVNGIAASDAESDSRPPAPNRNRKARRAVARLSASQPTVSPLVNSQTLVASPEIKSKSSSQPTASRLRANGDAESHPSHVSESDDAAPVAKRTRATTKTPPPSTPISRRTPLATPKSARRATPRSVRKAATPEVPADVEEPSTPTPRVTRSAKLNLLSQEPASESLESEEPEVEYISQDDPAYVPPASTRSPAQRRSTRRSSASIPPPSPAASKTPFEASPALPTTPRQTSRSKASATPSIPPSSTDSTRTPRATRSAAANGETPLFMSQSQPMATQHYAPAPVPSTPPPSTPAKSTRTPNGTPRSAKSAKRNVRLTSPIAEEDESADDTLPSQPNGRRPRSASPPGSADGSSIDNSTTISGFPLPRPPIRTRSAATLPSASFQPLSSLDRDSLRRGFGPIKLPSASAPARTRSSAALQPDEEASSSDDSSDDDQAADPALKGRYAGSKAPRKKVDRGKIGW